MASVCDCPWDSDCIGNCVMRDRVARTIPKSGNVCPNCKCPVEVGQECIDNAGLDCDGGGFFHRFHRQCFGLMESFGDAVCDGGWHYPFDLVEASGHAAAHGDEEFWRAWLLVYEETWAWTPEPPDPEPPTFTLPMTVHGITDMKIDGPWDVRMGMKKKRRGAPW